MFRDGIRMTNATWTVVALAAVLDRDELRRAVREALGLKIVSPRGLFVVLDRLGLRLPLAAPAARARSRRC
jgi:hypothetical protein